MALVLADRVREQSNTSGTGTITLSGAVTGYQTFSSAIGNGNTCYYTIANPGTTEWEVGIGTVGSGTLARTTIIASSNADAAVDFTAGTKDVFVTYPAEKSVYASNAPGTSGYILASGGAGVAPTWVAPSTIVSGAGGSNTQVQYNSSGALAGSSNLTFDGTTLTATGNAIISDNSTNAALRITQTGTGNALLVEDSSNPDSSPFVVDALGTLLAGFTTAPAGSYKAYISGSTFATSSYRLGDNTDGSTAGMLQNLSNSTKSTVLSADPDNLGTNTILRFDVDGTERMRIDSAGQVGIGITSSTGITLRVGKNLTGATSVFGVQSQGSIQSDATTGAYMFRTAPSTQATAFTLATLVHYDAAQSTIGAGSTVTNQYGFVANASLTGATNNYGFYSNIASGTGRYNFYAAGTADNYFAGNVGIGTSSPAAKLDVNGSIQVGYTASSQEIAVYNGDTTNRQRIRLVMSGTDGVIDANRASGTVPNMLFQIDGTERMRITSAGVALIGKTATGLTTQGIQLVPAGSSAITGPSGSVPLYINNIGTSSQSLLEFRTGTAATTVAGSITTDGTNLAINGYTNLIFGTNSTTERMRLDSSGNLGLGVTPSAWRSGDKVIDIGSTSSLVNAQSLETRLYQNAYVSSGGTNTYKTTAAAAYFGTSSGAFQWFNAPSGTAGTAITFTQAMTLDASGNLVLGTTAIASAEGYRFYKNYGRYDNGTFTGFIGGGTSLGSAAASDFVVRSENALAFMSGGSTERMRIDSSGNVGIGTGSPSALLHVSNASAKIRIGVDASSQYTDIFRDNATGYTVYNAAQAATFRGHIWQLGGSEAMRIDSSGNVGIGTSSTLSKFTVDGTFNAATTGSLPAITTRGTYGGGIGFYDTATSGFYAQDSGQTLNLFVGQSSSDTAASKVIMAFKASGNVGIGTTSPAQKLDVNGTVNFGNINTGNGVSTGTAALELGSLRTGDGVSLIDFHSVSGTDYETRIIRTGGANGSFLIDNTGTGAFTLRASGAANMVFDTSNTERMRINSSGNLLVGTSTNPSSGNVRQVLATSGDTYLQIASGSFGGGLIGQSAATMLFYTYTGAVGSESYSERMRIDGSGMLGLGITPNQTSGIAMEFGGSSNNNAINFLNSANCQGWITSNAYYNGTNWLRKYASGTTCTAYATNVNGTHAWYVAPASTAGSTISWTQAMTLDTSGNLLVGSTFGGATNLRLAVKGSGSTSSTSSIYAENSSGTSTFRVRDDGAIYTGTAAVSPYNNTTGVAVNMVVGSDGSLYRSTSSIKYKTNVQDAVHGLADVLKLRSVTYNGKNDGDIVFGGLIAEEVHEAGLTEFVQYAEDGSPDALAYGNMVSLCIKAIQELKAEVDSLKAQLNK